MIHQKNQRVATLLAFALIPLSGFATDIYLPSLPGMGTALHAGSIQVQTTITVFLISYGIAQLFIGSVLDSFGRYRLGLAGLFIFMLASLVIAASHNIYLIYVMRAIHGITVAMIVVAKRAFFVDLYQGDKLKHYLSLFTIIWSAGPIIAPFVGGFLQNAFGWQSNFYFLGGVAAFMFVLELVFSGETLAMPLKFDLGKITRIYIQMIGTTSFTLGLLMLGFAYSMVMVYNMTGPYIIEHQLGSTALVSGYCSLILGIAWMIGGFIGKAAINKPFIKKMLVNGMFQVIFITVMIIGSKFVSDLYSLVFFAFLVNLCAGFTYNNYFTYCMRKFPQNAGIAGGLTGGVAYVIVSLLSYGIVFFIPAHSQFNLSLSYLILIMLSLLTMLVIFRQSRRMTDVANARN